MVFVDVGKRECFILFCNDVCFSSNEIIIYLTILIISYTILDNKLNLILVLANCLLEI